MSIKLWHSARFFALRSANFMRIYKWRTNIYFANFGYIYACMKSFFSFCCFLSLFAVRNITAAQALNNLGFEGTYTAVATGWYQNTWGSPVVPDLQYSRETSITHSGSSSQKIQINDLGDGATILAQDYDFTAGHVYYGEIWLRSDSAVTVAFMYQERVPYYFVPAVVVKQVGTAWTLFQIRGGYDRNIFTDQTNIQGRFVIQPLTKGTLYVDDAAFADGTASVISGPVADTGIIPASYFGMHLNKLGVHQTYPPVGQGMMRLWNTGTEWADIESYNGAMLNPQNWIYNSSANNGFRLDYYVDFIQTNDPTTEMIYTMGQSPSWAAGNNTLPPDNLADWQNYVSIAGNRYHNKIRYWEPWNEVDYSGTYSGSLQKLDSISLIAFQELKNIDPANKILSPNFTGPEMLAHYLYEGGGGHEDIISWHHYPSRTPEDMIPEIIGMQDLMQNYNLSGKPLWNTEGAITIPNTGSFDPGEEAAALCRAYVVQWSFGVSNFNWYAWDVFGGSLTQYARLSYSATPNQYDSITPAGEAYRQTALWMKGAKMKSRAIMGATWMMGLERPGGYKAWIVWNTAGPLSFNLPSFMNVIQYRDLAGNVVQQTGSSVQISQSPILLENSDALNVLQVSPSISYFLSPNPALDACTIHFNKHDGNGWCLHLYNGYGQLVKTNTDISDDEVVIRRNGLPAGLYFVVVTAKNGSRSCGKLIFE
jgi:hypothetical protein